MLVSDGNDRQSLKVQIEGLAEKVAASMGMEVILVEMSGESGRAVVRIFIDQSAGISLEDCERFSKRFSVALDVEDWITFKYVLEVSSPGVNRPLVKEKDFQRFTGKNARVRTCRPIEGQRNFKGRIVGVNEGRVTLDAAPDKQISIAISDIEKAGLIADLSMGRRT